MEELKEKYLSEVEKFHTKRHQPKIKREEGKPHGTCIFYDNGCTLHPVKPMECKVSSGCNGQGEDINQWVLFHTFVNPADPQSVREWASWLKFRKPITGAKVEEIVPDEKKRKKILSYEV